MIPDRTRRTILISTIHATTPLIASLVPERLRASTVASEGVDKLRLDNKRITRPKEAESLLFTEQVRYENVVKSKQNWYDAPQWFHIPFNESVAWRGIYFNSSALRISKRSLEEAALRLLLRLARATFSPQRLTTRHPDSPLAFI